MHAIIGGERSDCMAIGEKLAKLLEDKKKKPGTLARETGISKNTIYSILRRNNTKVNYSYVEKIAENLGVPVEYFFDIQPVEAAPLKVETDELSPLTDDEAELLRDYRNADPVYRRVARELLREHPMEETSHQSAAG